jgi:hypothetical protein
VFEEVVGDGERDERREDETVVSHGKRRGVLGSCVPVDMERGGPPVRMISDVD